ncbi:MAG: hypothetical protein BWY73_00713 [candidate division TA06 bacterium ADurb.Bin417]|uniref:Uncharacterized protein n=1 Tax=candidate division TA06 bacterium ADurb.Bin417 TaxID=1852828 RepID=A0A1V5MHH1_UNCT6|nr:MAG: hypothetical protein BWY73_00713 [candidate division TA06 bacterium ADurb.Bin417]
MEMMLITKTARPVPMVTLTQKSMVVETEAGMAPMPGCQVFRKSVCL